MFHFLFGRASSCATLLLFDYLSSLLWRSFPRDDRNLLFCSSIQLAVSIVADRVIIEELSTFHSYGTSCPNVGCTHHFVILHWSN